MWRDRASAAGLPPLCEGGRGDISLAADSWPKGLHLAHDTSTPRSGCARAKSDNASTCKTGLSRSDKEPARAIVNKLRALRGTVCHFAGSNLETQPRINGKQRPPYAAPNSFLIHFLVQIRFFILQNRAGKTRLSKWYVDIEEDEKRKIEAEAHRMVTLRDNKYTNFVEVRLCFRIGLAFVCTPAVPPSCGFRA